MRKVHFSKYVLFVFILYTPFHKALATNESESINHNLYNAFYSAITSDSFIEIKEFLQFGIDLNHKYNGDLTPLMIAANFESERSVKTLIDLGANTELVSKEKMTALDYAEKTNNKAIISILQRYSFNNKPLVKEIQYYLKILNYNTGKIDGVLGRKTVSALKKFAKDTKQAHPAEISQRQVEILKNTYFYLN